MLTGKMRSHKQQHLHSHICPLEKRLVYLFIYERLAASVKPEWRERQFKIIYYKSENIPDILHLHRHKLHATNLNERMKQLD